MHDDADQNIDPCVEAFNEQFDDSVAEIKIGSITLQRAARELAETYQLSVGSMEIQLSEATGKPMSLPYCDYWDRPASFMSEMCEQLESTLEARLTSYLGGGKQGHVFLDNEHRVVKITRSLQEALFAHYLLSLPDKAFPSVHSVESHSINDVPVFLIRRDHLRPLIEITSEEQPTLAHTLIKAAWADIRRQPTSSHLTSALTDLEASAPRLRQQLTDLARSLTTFRDGSGLTVSDVHVENIGFVADQSRLVVMDFGMNDFTSVLGYSFLESIPKRIAEATLTHTR